MRNVVVWISRHRMLPGVRRELERLLGPVFVVWVDRTYRHVDDVLSDVEKIAEAAGAGRVYVLPVLPLGMVRKMLERNPSGVTFLWAEFKELHRGCGGPGSCPDFNPKTDVYHVDTHKRFTGIKRLKAVRIELEDLSVHRLLPG